ncbi:MAG: hypothetical protein K9K37_13390 [Desulfocapsa sp.]|nr:hypothetical protein [Desulfocapsa sp.]
MRCPKCGYISFDHVETCLKCQKNIAGSTEVQGTTYQAASPSFLKVVNGYDSVDESDSSTEVGFEGPDDEFDYSDPDLNVLVDGEKETDFGDMDEPEDMLSLEDSDLGAAAGDDFQIETDEGGFDFEFEAGAEEQGADLSLNLPDELSDISDLAPPERGQTVDSMSLSLDDDLDLDDLDLDLGLGGESSEVDDDLSFSLDDLDLSVEDDSGLGGLDMDLDLGGLDEKESPAPKSEKSSGSLDDLFLSLD